jgi:hypothetical protein
LHTPPGATTKALTDNFLEVRLNAYLPANQSVRLLISGFEHGGLTGCVAA